MLAKEFINKLLSNGYESFYGVPDSLMSSLSKSLEFDFKKVNNFITSNEGSALSMAMGYNLSTEKVPVIYLQNSGLGNIVNPYNSLLNDNIYDIPFLLLIGWRGEPGHLDEPQHFFQGQVTLEQLKIMKINYSIIEDEDDFNNSIIKFKKNNSLNKPYALVIKRGFFDNDKRAFVEKNTDLSRSLALETIVNKFGSEPLYVSTTGKLSRELYKYRNDKSQEHDDLYLIGGMGHAFSIGYSIAIENPKKLVVCLDGDGSILMHLGSMGIVSKKPIDNFIHIVFNNSSHESVGGQPNYFDNLDIKNLVYSLGYKSFIQVESIKEIKKINFNVAKPLFINVEINNESEKNLIRPSKTPSEIKKNFVNKIKK